ncbi:MAG: hypothetical protein R3274_00245, partial [Desulfobacterales bacterium]|nr:hypothetical protein [Desulfobacterales bacterium]
MDIETAEHINNIIDCPQCSVKNPIESDICYNCGVSLHGAPSAKTRRSWIPVFLSVLFAAGLVYFFYTHANFTLEICNMRTGVLAYLLELIKFSISQSSFTFLNAFFSPKL